MLALWNTSLSGLLPSELGRLTHMEWLYLGINSLSGRIFTEIGEMTSLIELDLSANSFIGTIPSELGWLVNLTWLDLSNMVLLTGSFPSELSMLTSLLYLNLSGSSGLSGTIPTEFCHLQNQSCTFIDYLGRSYNCTLDFDCSNILCGCDCPCSNDTKSNFGNWCIWSFYQECVSIRSETRRSMALRFPLFS